jgi:hypothetical protein
MAENESLDLGGPYAKRWDAVCEHIRNGASSEEVASKVEIALYKGLRKALKQFQEKGVTLADLHRSRDRPQDQRQILHKIQGHDYARLFVEAAAVSGPTETDCVAGWIDAVLDKVTDQICHRVAGNGNLPTIDDVRAFTGEVRDKLTPVIERIVTKLAEDPNWLPRRPPTRGGVPVNGTAELLNMSLLGDVTE